MSRTLSTSAQVNELLARRKFRTPKPSVLLDLGHAWCKVGFTGEPLPRHIVPSPLLNTTYKMRMGQLTDLERSALRRLLKTFLQHIFINLLLLSTKESTVLLCENNLTRSLDRDLMLEILLVDFKFQSASHLPNLSACVLANGCTTGLVIDCGYEMVRILPIVSGIPITRAWQELSLGGSRIADQMLVGLQSITAPTSNIVNILESDRRAMLEVMEHTSVIVPNATHYNNVPDLHHHVRRPGKSGSSTILIPGRMRCLAGEVLFDWGDDDGNTLTRAVIQSISRCPRDVRKLLTTNLIISGGTCMIPGFRARLLSTINENLANNPEYSCLNKLQASIRQPPGDFSTPPSCLGWVGASMFPSDLTSTRGVNLEKFLQTCTHMTAEVPLIG